MKTTLLAALTFLSLAAWAGPGVSSGDEQPTTKQDYVCADERIQDNYFTASFLDVFGPQPTVRVSIPDGEFYSITGMGFCYRPEDSDEFYLKCAVPTRYGIYQVSLTSFGAPGLHGTIRLMESSQSTIVLDCTGTEHTNH